MTLPSYQAAAGTTAPFGLADTAPVTGGTLTFAHAGPPPDEADSIVLAIHGITSNLMVWASVARAMGPDSPPSIVAPDLRGRAASAALPGPYGFSAHVADMLALLDHLRVVRAVVVGHSMGAYVAARLAAEHPDRVAALVLADGGVPVAHLKEEAAAAARAVLIGPAVACHAQTFTSIRDYLAFWRRMHPALAGAWGEDVEAYLLHALGGTEHALRYVLNLGAIERDSDEMLFDPVSRTWVEHVGVPIHLLRAPQGAMDDDHPLIPHPALERFIAEHPTAVVEQVEGVNHYSLVLGDSPGPDRVAAAISAAARKSQTRS
jgi:pimeloyl-ACP methyl ester carboxylesterase